ncbi:MULTISPECIES: TetR/AcrR family transcriptional regulator [Streptomyces]|uniref:TetR/AcrR family transcriptional regulator n=1 Tax=Streptomyces koelreuteriae TaxID=2838015 RepID=A0ABX8G271_9ACTN|nr:MULTISPECIES: TetR/AcrR family transcriptional regulator [Streptomyces]QWB27625.1 TetR/AcrR family transcriptional regulator [Streptomyces koelreuteriae]UUA10720.1 TetR family transcriptional regulator [Streptomyces koelreuteriae]UUA18327.1 TetR family transcriptional regulator [Streptomyces sp. CRCS-T-1]
MSTKVRTADTRERILTAACEVIADIGFEKIRMRMVAERAGVSTALLHYHFDTREKLFTEAMTHSFAHTAVDLEHDAETAPAAVILARILRNLLPTDPQLHQDWRLWQELWVRALRDETTRVFAVDLYAQLHAWVGDAVRRGIDSGEFTPTDVDDLSTLVLSLSDGYGIRLMLRDPTVTLDTALTAVWRHVSTALGLPDTVPTE